MTHGAPDRTRGAHEDNYLMLDCSKAHARLGWKPVIDLRTALRWTVDWAKSFQAKADMRNVTERQIVQFMTIAENRVLTESRSSVKKHKTCRSKQSATRTAA